MWVTHTFEHWSLHKYISVARDQEGVDLKSMIDLVLVKNAKLRYVQDVMVVRGMGRGISDQHVVLYKVSAYVDYEKRDGELGKED